MKHYLMENIKKNRSFLVVDSVSKTATMLYEGNPKLDFTRVTLYIRQMGSTYVEAILKNISEGTYPIAPASSYRFINRKVFLIHMGALLSSVSCIKN